MHPEILRELNAQRTRELRDRAHQASLARSVSRALRGLRRHAHPADELAVPAIPDYVDGSFRTAADEPAGNGPGNGHSQAPAARHAA
jgi:hypothetical protein